MSRTPTELRRFLVVGTLTVLIDYGAYRAFLLLAAAVDLSKALGFLIGTLFAYFANRRFTFESSAPHGWQPARFGLVYLSTLVANVVANALALKALAGFPLAVTLAFLVATGVSATLNFLAMKYWVFRARVRTR